MPQCNFPGPPAWHGTLGRILTYHQDNPNVILSFALGELRLHYQGDIPIPCTSINMLIISCHVKSRLSMQQYMSKYEKIIITFMSIMHNISNHIIYKLLGKNHSPFCTKFRTPPKNHSPFCTKFRTPLKMCTASIFMPDFNSCAQP